MNQIINVLYRAEYFLENGFGEYNLVRNYCEDFALYCKTGKKGMWVRSGQVSQVVAGLTAAVPLVMGGVFVGITAATEAEFAAFVTLAGLAVTPVCPTLGFIWSQLGCAQLLVLLSLLGKRLI